MKICPECKDVIMYCKCAEEKIATNEKEIYNNLISYCESEGRLHPATNLWFDLYHKILTKPESIKTDKSEDGMIVQTISYGSNRPEIDPVRFSGPYIIRIVTFHSHIKYAYKIGKIKISLEVHKNFKKLVRNKQNTIFAILDGAIVDKHGRSVLSYGDIIRTNDLKTLSEVFKIKKYLSVAKVLK